MTALSIAAKWRARSLAEAGTPAHPLRALVYALLLSYGLVLGTRFGTLFTVYAPLAWLALPFVGRAGHAAVALAFGFAATMLGVLVCQTASPLPFGVPIHPAFGEHPVTLRAGFPWQGIEGCQFQWPLARDCIPFTMGVDALLVNLTVCTAVCWFALRRARPDAVAALPGVAGVCAAVLGLCGTWQLAVMFD